MAKQPAQTFRDLLVWQKSHALVLEVYKLTRRLPKEELFGLVSQMRRAARHMNIAQGSLEELHSGVAIVTSPFHLPPSTF